MRELDHVRKIALALPEVNERLSHGEPCFFVRDKRPLCYFHDNHNGDGRVSLWCPVPPDVQDDLVAAEPDRFFAPPTSARGVFSGWVGMYLDGAGPHKVNWREVSAILEDAFRNVAPKTLVSDLDLRSNKRTPRMRVQVVIATLRRVLVMVTSIRGFVEACR